MNDPSPISTIITLATRIGTEHPRAASLAQRILSAATEIVIETRADFTTTERGAKIGAEAAHSPLRRFVIEREIPRVGTLEREELRQAAIRSNEALRQLAPDVQWVESYVADDRTFCVYLARDEAVIRRHAEMSGFPASRITEIRRTIDPTTAQSG
jgi:uncharacterized protein DUF4242